MRQARRRRLAKTSFLGVLCVGAACAAPLVLVAPVGADQVATLKAQAAQVSQQIVLEQLQVGGDQQQYATAVARSQQDEQLAAQTQGQITADEQRVGRDAGQLRHDAVAAYVNAGTAGATPLFGDQGAAGARSEYTQVVSGDLAVAVDQLRTDRQVLGVQETARQQAIAADQADQVEAHTLLSAAQSTEARLAATNAQVTGELATAVAQQQATVAQAAAVAVRAAQSQATRTPPAQPTEIVVGAQTAPSGSGTDPALNSFLQCVVQHESGGNYQIASPNGQYMGAFQFSQPTWNEAAQLANRPTLVGVPPNQASKADQDTLAVALYSADGEQPWYDPCNPASS
jgi:hypothetical protein